MNRWRHAIALACFLLLPAAPAGAAPLFKHVVIIIQENRTPDNLFGSNPTFEPGVDIATSGINSLGQTIPLTAEPLGSCYDVLHSHASFEAMLTEGADQELLNVPTPSCVPPSNPQFKFADNSTQTIQPYFAMATDYGFANRMFQTDQGPSFPAHLFLFAGTSAPSTESPHFAAENPLLPQGGSGCIAQSGQTVAIINANGSETTNPVIYPCTNHPAMSDLLNAAGLSWRYYTPAPGSIWTAPAAISHICGAVSAANGTLSCQGTDWTDGSVVAGNPAQVLTDIANCNLAAVNWVIPTAPESDHAGETNGTGPQWVASIVNAIGKQSACPSHESYWGDTVIFVTWDDWGGWYDHVPPFQINLAHTNPGAWGNGYTYGFRLPLLVISTKTKKGLVDNTVHDFGSILYFIERNFGLGFIGPTSSVFGQYADYQAYLRGDTMNAFFPLPGGRPFTPIPTTMTPADFRNQPRPTTGPDADDGN